MTFDTSQIPNRTYYTAYSIGASVALEFAAEVIFQAGVKVESDGGFDVPLGAAFDALIGGCP